jgi:hypothetical protein
MAKKLQLSRSIELCPDLSIKLRITSIKENYMEWFYNDAEDQMSENNSSISSGSY